MRRRFFVNGFANGSARLTGGGAHHLGGVLRAQPGQLYELSDGHEVHLAKVERVAPEEVTFSLVSPVAAPQSPLRATLLLAIVKFDRFEWALEKSVELGAEFIIPLAAARSESNLIAAAAKRAERWRKIIRESAQQARCRRLPELLPLARSVDAFRAAPPAEIRVLLSERNAATPLRQVLAAVQMQAPSPPSPVIAPSAPASSATAGEMSRASAGRLPASPPPDIIEAVSVKLCLAIGPEGGWTDPEFAVATAAGFVEASLGANILRTETAVAAGLAAAHLYFDT